MYRQHDAGAGAEQQYQLSADAGMSHFGQTQYPPSVYGVGTNLQGSPQQQQHLRPALGTHGRSSSNDFAGTMQPPSGSSPRIHSTSPVREHGSSYRPTDRSLPSKDVAAETLTEAFVKFILYCNPKFPLDTDTSALRTGFESPPKSDGKDFNTWDLFQLIQKLDCKEIKTWNQLALDLGVEAPDVSKGQSVQKVQQYTVRLKRWMRAMHIDAFFEYLFGKQHLYFLEVPPPGDPYPSSGRDGVMAEEDLAIRALDPSLRPKRGRRRNSETEAIDSTARESATQPQQLLDRTHPYSVAPFSAYPDHHNDPWAIASAVTPQSFAPWSARAPASAVSTTAPSTLRWQLGHSHTPSTPHPMSAIPTSMSAQIDSVFDGEPKSAVTPSTRKRRKHGPAVSSAWPSSSAPGTKPRGRPPASRNLQDGPFGTFPADPNNTKARGQVPVSTLASDNKQASFEPSSPQKSLHDSQRHPEGRPGRLSLQVPPHTGAPVRLATPPALQINGEARELETRSDSDDPHRGFTAMVPYGVPIATQRLTHTTAPETNTPGFSFEALKRVLTSDLLRADIQGRQHRLSGEEAKRLADSMLDRMNMPRTEANAKDDIARLSAATWLGVGDQANVPFNTAAGHGKRITVTRFRTDYEGYEEIVNDDTIADDIRETFDVQWHASMGGCVGAFEMKGLPLSGPGAASEGTIETTHDMILRKGIEAIYKVDRKGWVEDSIREIARSAAKTQQGGEENIDWKARCKALEFAANVARGEVERAKKRIYDKIIDAVL